MQELLAEQYMYIIAIAIWYASYTLIVQAALVTTVPIKVSSLALIGYYLILTLHPRKDYNVLLCMQYRLCT